MEQLLSSDTRPNITVSRDSDIETLKQGQHRLEGAIVMLADRVNGTDSREAIALLQAILEATREKSVVQYQPVQLSSGQNGQQNLGEISVVPIERHRPSPKQQALVEWLNTNHWHDMTVREIAGLTGVSKSLVAETIKQLNQ